jgi:hypothetical protein
VYLPQGDDVMEHWYKARPGEQGASEKGKIKRAIPIPPPIIKKYSKDTGGVDLFDQCRSYFKLELRSLKYWHPMFWFNLESAMVNAWVLSCQTMEAHKLKVGMDQRHFGLQIALGLAAEWEAQGCTMGLDTAISPSKAFSVSNKRIRLHVRSQIDEHDTRFESVDSHAGFFAKLPEKEGVRNVLKMTAAGKKIYPSHRSLYCRYCVEVLKLEKPRRTSFFCKKCKKPLCKGLCFQMWHAVAAKK